MGRYEYVQQAIVYKRYTVICQRQDTGPSGMPTDTREDTDNFGDGKY